MRTSSILEELWLRISTAFNQTLQQQNTTTGTLVLRCHICVILRCVLITALLQNLTATKMELMAKLSENQKLLAKLNATFTSQNSRQLLVTDIISVVASALTATDSLGHVFAQQQMVARIHSNVMTLENVLKQQIDFLNLTEEAFTMAFQNFNNIAGLEKELEVWNMQNIMILH